MTGPVRVFSDLHLGHPVSRIARVAALRPLLEGAATAVFNGDTWQELTLATRERSAEMLQELRDLCTTCGCEPVFLSGNHDPGWPGPGWVELAGGRIVVTHGDALLYDGSPWRREILTNQKRVRALWDAAPEAAADVEQRLRLAREIARLLPARKLPGGRHLWQRAWDAVMPPQRALHMLQAWWNQGTLGAEFCDRYFPAAEVLVIGHFHRHGMWRRGSRLVINTGSFVSPDRARFMEWDGHTLRRVAVDEAPDRYTPGAVLDVWRL